MLNEDEILRDKNGDLDPNGLNPVNPHPSYPGDYPPSSTRSSQLPRIDEINDSKENRRPNSIGRSNRCTIDRAGPFFQYLTTDLTTNRWIGSVLILKKIHLSDPKLEFECQVKIDEQWEILYENLFDFCIYRVQLSIEIVQGENEEKIDWKLIWIDDEQIHQGSFFVPHSKQKWRGAFFSCNGFDATVNDEIIENLTYSNVWNHLLGEHERNRYHLLIWGGDQIYIDFIFEDIPYLRAWVHMDWNSKWTTEFRLDLKEQVEFYYFNSYLENWTKRKEVRFALESIPSLMIWDDHDIFDGAGSYPPLLHDSPMMMGLFHCAQKMRLLFQHQTTMDKARQHRLFGFHSYNQFSRCGQTLAIICCDGRTERTTEQVQHPTTTELLFKEIEKNAEHLQHLIVVFPVPFSFVRVRVVESILHQMKNSTRKFRENQLVKQTNSIFGLPEFYDDLLDEWTHQNHIEERNHLLQLFQNLSKDKRIRISYFSGDVHCSALSRFRSSNWKNLSMYDDYRLMYQIISSAIVNMPPSLTATRFAHRFQTRWNPIEQTQEEIVDFFQRKPENNRIVFHQKFRPNRNFVSFQQISSSSTLSSANFYASNGFCQCFPSNSILPSNRNVEKDFLDLKIRFWLEPTRINYRSEDKHFASYDLIIPHLQ